MLEIHLSIALDGHLFWYLFLWGFQWFILLHFSCLLLYRSQGPMFGFLLQSKASWTPKMVHILTGSDTCFCFFLSHQRDAAVVVSLCTQPKSVNSFKTSMTLMLPPWRVPGNTSGSECWLLSAGISQECAQKFPLYTSWIICTLYQLWNGLVSPSWPNLLLVDHVSYQNQALTEHAYSYSYFNWRTNYNVVFTDHSSSRNSFDTETCITSALRWVIRIVFSFKRPILSPFCYPLDLLVQAEGCAGLQGCVILNLSSRTWLTKNLEH